MSDKVIFQPKPNTFYPTADTSSYIGTKIGNYTIKKVLGGGTQAKVYLVTKGSSEYAIKQISLVKAQNPELTFQLAVNEMVVLKKLNHQHVVRVLDAPFKTDNNLYIVTQFYKDGDLLRHIMQNGLLNESTAKKYLHQLSDALDHVASNKIVHRDIKLENIFIDGDNAVIGDFGIAINDKNEIINGSTVPYLPPEASLTPEQQYTSAGDVWALGMTFYFAIFGCDPMGIFKFTPSGIILDHSKNNSLNRSPKSCGQNLLFPSIIPISEQLKKVLRGMLTYEIRDRWTFSQIFEELEKNPQDGLGGSVNTQIPGTVGFGGGVFIEDDIFDLGIPEKIRLLNVKSSKFTSQNKSKSSHPEDWLDLQEATCDLFQRIITDMIIFAEKKEVSNVAPCLKMLAGLSAKLLAQRALGCIKLLQSQKQTSFFNKYLKLFNQFHQQAENFRTLVHLFVKDNLNQNHHKRDVIISILSEQNNSSDSLIPQYIGEGLYFMFNFSEKVVSMAPPEKKNEAKYNWHGILVEDWRKNMCFICLLDLMDLTFNSKNTEEGTTALNYLQEKLPVASSAVFADSYTLMKKYNNLWKLMSVGQN